MHTRAHAPALVYIRTHRLAHLQVSELEFKSQHRNKNKGRLLQAAKRQCLEGNGLRTYRGTQVCLGTEGASALDCLDSRILKSTSVVSREERTGIASHLNTSDDTI